MVGMHTVLIFCICIYVYWFSGIVRYAYSRRAYGSNILYMYMYIGFQES